ncbi:phenylacetate--CoA ligase family protein [Gimesia panareensis]|uniref:phenylacetate--CoA ligase family protein n=1 Tax=Gimesia panareensis TaxID=2527978 RepID=UPI00118956F1|nr:AMP-binding protein [Gimesia panareensis]QDU53180.1 Phenylacetate-coenzyme A ligase [Gimesia panareensis]
MNQPDSQPENLDRDALEARQLQRLQHLLKEVSASNPFWQQKWNAAGVDVDSIQSLADLQKLPITTKAELVEDHLSNAPYGTNLTYPVETYTRMHQTSGTTGSPMRWLDTKDSWDWFGECWAQIYRMVGLFPEDRLFFPFSFGPFVGFWAAFEGATRRGNFCLAGGGMGSEARLKMILDNKITAVCCTPTYALRLAEVAEAENIDLAGSRVRALVVAGEPGGNIEATKQRIGQGWGARVFDHWGMTEIGALGIEPLENPGGLNILETECIPEIVNPDTMEPVERGAQGELLITNLGRVGSPLIRYRTGDLVCEDTTPCPSGRSLLRLKGGILGRADDMVIIRGNNVFPSSLEAILRTFDQVAEYRIEVRTIRAMQHMKIELEPVESISTMDQQKQIINEVSHAIKDRLNFNAEVTTVAPGALPRFELKGKRFFKID